MDTTKPGGCGCQTTSTSTGFAESFDLAAIPSPVPTRAAAMASLRRDFHAEDLRRHEKQVAIVSWERSFGRAMSEGSGPPVIVAVETLQGNRVVPRSVAEWMSRNPRP